MDFRNVFADGLRGLGYSPPFTSNKDIAPILAEALRFPQFPNDMAGRPIHSQLAQYRAASLVNHLRFQFVADNVEARLLRDEEARIAEMNRYKAENDDLRRKVVEATKISQQAISEREGAVKSKEVAEASLLASKEALDERNRAVSALSEEKEQLLAESVGLSGELDQVRQGSAILQAQVDKFPGRILQAQNAAIRAVLAGFVDVYGDGSYDFNKVEAAADIHLGQLAGRSYETPPSSPSEDDGITGDDALDIAVSIGQDVMRGLDIGETVGSDQNQVVESTSVGHGEETTKSTDETVGQRNDENAADQE